MSLKTSALAAARSAGLTPGIRTGLIPRWRCCIPACLLSMLMAAAASAAEPVVYLVEEEWEMKINEPEVAINSPQVALFLFPDASREDCYFQLQMNYAAEEGYSSGGFRVGAFSNETPVDEERSVVQEMLAWDNDVLTWTSAMAVFNGKLMYALKNGNGMQWGSFGGPDYLVEMDCQGVTSLENYSPQKSLEFVDFQFGANRVHSVRLKRVHLTYTDGSTQTVQIDQSVQQ
jgi:hypothetical protein